MKRHLRALWMVIVRHSDTVTITGMAVMMITMPVVFGTVLGIWLALGIGGFFLFRAQNGAFWRKWTTADTAVATLFLLFGPLGLAAAFWYHFNKKEVAKIMR